MCVATVSNGLLGMFSMTVSNSAQVRSASVGFLLQLHCNHFFINYISLMEMCFR